MEWRAALERTELCQLCPIELRGAGILPRSLPTGAGISDPLRGPARVFDHSKGVR